MYLNDILIIILTEEERERRAKKILECLLKESLLLKLKKRD